MSGQKMKRKSKDDVRIKIVPLLQPDPAEPEEIALLRAILAYLYASAPPCIKWTST